MALSCLLVAFLLLPPRLVTCLIRICRKLPLLSRIPLDRLVLLLLMCPKALISLLMIFIRKVRKVLSGFCEMVRISLWILFIGISMALESKFFKESEFERCFPVCSLSDMDQVFIDKLDSAREIAGVPFVLNCAYRSPSWDKSRGRSGSGYHTKGRAVDVRCVDSSDRYKLVRACVHCGLSVGVYRTFLHIDDREEPILFWSY